MRLGPVGAGGRPHGATIRDDASLSWVKAASRLADHHPECRAASGAPELPMTCDCVSSPPRYGETAAGTHAAIAS